MEAMRAGGKQQWYIAHPVSGTPEEVVANIASAIAWTRWLCDNIPERIYAAPWLGQVQAYQDTGEPITEEFYARCLLDDCAMVARYDGVLCVGGKMGRGMKLEAQAAADLRISVSYWSDLRSPPAPGQATQALREMILTGYNDS